MGSIYLSATINSPKKEVLRYEGGYITNTQGYYIGRYDEKFIYGSSHSFDSDHIGTISFNYGYLRSSNDIFVIANNDGSLSVNGNKYAAYYDGDIIGAIAAFIVGYQKGLIPISTTNSCNSSSKSSTPKNSSTSNQYSYSSNSGIGLPESGWGCLGIILTPLLILIFIYVGFAAWFYAFKDTFNEGIPADIWVLFIPIISVILGIHFHNKDPKKNLFDIAATHLTAYPIPIAIGSIIYAIQAGGALQFFAGALGLCIYCIPPFIIGVLYSYFKEKSR